MLSEEQAGLRLPRAAIRDERIKLAVDMLALALKEAALLPTRQQEDMREAVKRLRAVQQWCKAHPRVAV